MWRTYVETYVETLHLWRHPMPSQHPLTSRGICKKSDRHRPVNRSSYEGANTGEFVEIYLTFFVGSTIWFYIKNQRVCFLIYGVKRRSGGDGSQIYGVKRRSGHDGSQSFGPIWHVSGPEMVFWRNDIMILHHFCWRSSKIKLFWPKALIFDQKSRKYLKNHQKYQKIHGFLGIPSGDLCGDLCGDLLMHLLTEFWMSWHRVVQTNITCKIPKLFSKSNK